MSNLKLFNQTITDARTQEYLNQVLAAKKNSFVNNLTALVSNSAKLQRCDPQTLLFAGLKATALDLPLDPNLGFAYVIPYENRNEGKVQAQFQLGYRGFIQLAIRSGQFKTINVTEVKEGELVTFDLLTGETRFEAKPGREQLPTIGYAAFFRLNNGFEKTLYMTREEVEAHAKKYSQTYGSNKDYIQRTSKWTTDFDAMAKKTVLKLLLSRFAPLSVEMQQAVTSDQGVLDKEGRVSYPDRSLAAEDVAVEVDAEVAEDTASEDIDFETGEVTEAQTAPTEPQPEASSIQAPF